MLCGLLIVFSFPKSLQEDLLQIMWNVNGIYKYNFEKSSVQPSVIRSIQGKQS